METTNRLLFCLVLAGALAGAGCVSTVTPGQGTHNEWAGTYARKQAAQKDADREIALDVRQAFAADPRLKALGLRIFVSRGEVTLCGGFPDARTRARAIGVASTVKGVSGVDTDCGKN